MLETHPFAPFVPKGTKYLLLGSFTGKIMPGNNYDWYYGTKRNQFWKIIEGVYGYSLEHKIAKQKLFTKIKLAVTDIIYKCERKKGTNLDNNLVNIVYNTDALNNIFNNKKIKTVYFSSRFVEKHFKKLFKNYIENNPVLTLITLPSPSPRYAKLSLSQKILEYKKLLPKV